MELQALSTLFDDIVTRNLVGWLRNFEGEAAGIVHDKIDLLFGPECATDMWYTWAKGADRKNLNRALALRFRAAEDALRN